MANGDNVQTGYSCDDWERHYDTDDLRWDLGEVAPPFERLWEERNISPCKAIIPGCGRGHEAVFLAERGFQITAVDYTRGAVSLLDGALAAKNLPGEVLHLNFFELDAKYNNSFDLMLEHTFFCAINPDMRQEYVTTAGRILKSGALFIGLFYETGEKDGPPFNTGKRDIEECFSEKFEIEILNKTIHSAERRQGKEWLAILKRK
jgi:SAM-dependent methyltransferase